MSFHLKQTASNNLLKYAHTYKKWFKPETSRELSYIYFAKLTTRIKGAFIVRKTADKNNYCITLLNKPELWPDEKALKHILIRFDYGNKSDNKKEKNASNANANVNPQFRITYKSDKNHYLFDSLVELIDFYLNNDMNCHFDGIETHLVDVFKNDRIYDFRIP